jgi:hypothetical protein
MDILVNRQKWQNLNLFNEYILKDKDNDLKDIFSNIKEVL